jgi:hypothetical protein
VSVEISRWREELRLGLGRWNFSGRFDPRQRFAVHVETLGEKGCGALNAHVEVIGGRGSLAIRAHR